MKQVSAMFGLLLTLCLACTDDADKKPARSDAGMRDASEEMTKPRADAALDSHALLIAALIEIERTLLARCPCHVENGVFETMRECVEGVSLGRQWVDCANAADLSDLDDAQVRANLRCSIEELMQRTDCLMGSACSDQAVANCMTMSLNCPMLPLDVLSHVAVECSIAFSH